MALKNFLRNNWPAVTTAVTAVAIVIAAIVILRTLPPHTIVMATGPEGGAYYEVGKRYRAVLARAGVEVRLVPTAGSLENLDLLHDPRSRVDVALIQSGTVSAQASAELESLGTLFYEPLWMFSRRDPGKTILDHLRGGKVSVGPIGSGTRLLALELLKRSGLDRQVGELLDLSPWAAAEKLLAGEIDAALVLNSWESPTVQQLLADERIELTGFSRADAYVALYPFLTKLVLPRGVADLAKDLPPADVVLLAPKASLVVREDLHSAIQYLLLDAAVQIHSAPGAFQRAGQFPAAEAIEIPLSSEALQFYKTGRPFLHNYLPFWMASLAGKLIVLLIPILGLLYPLLRSLPPLYDWIIRNRILRIYGELRILEDEISAGGRTGRDLSEMNERLDRLEGHAKLLRIPAAYVSLLFMLINHINLVRERLRK
jgi:TRAP transporter TAXI family solute receptor